MQLERAESKAAVALVFTRLHLRAASSPARQGAYAFRPMGAPPQPAGLRSRFQPAGGGGGGGGGPVSESSTPRWGGSGASKGPPRYPGAQEGGRRGAQARRGASLFSYSRLPPSPSAVALLSCLCAVCKRPLRAHGPGVTSRLRLCLACGIWFRRRICRFSSRSASCCWGRSRPSWSSCCSCEGKVGEGRKAEAPLHIILLLRRRRQAAYLSMYIVDHSTRRSAVVAASCRLVPRADSLGGFLLAAAAWAGPPDDGRSVSAAGGSGGAAPFRRFVGGRAISRRWRAQSSGCGLSLRVVTGRVRENKIKHYCAPKPGAATAASGRTFSHTNCPPPPPPNHQPPTPSADEKPATSAQFFEAQVATSLLSGTARH